MIYFIFGSDIFRAQEQIKTLANKARESGAHVSSIHAQALTPEIFRDHLTLPGLFAEKRLVIYRNILSEGSTPLKEEVGERLNMVPKDVEVIFWEQNDPDRRTTLYKQLTRKARLVEMMPLKPAELARWVKDRIKKKGGHFDDEAASLLVQSVGSDLFLMEQELIKLTNYAGSRPVSADDVRLLVAGSVPPSIFELLDTMGRNPGKAGVLIEQLLAAGQEPLYLLSMMVYQVRTLLLVADLKHRNPHITPLDVAGKLRLHPFVAQKSLDKIKEIPLSQLVESHHLLAKADQQIKTGLIDPADALVMIGAKNNR